MNKKIPLGNFLSEAYHLSIVSLEFISWVHDSRQSVAKQSPRNERFSYLKVSSCWSGVELSLPDMWTNKTSHFIWKVWNAQQTPKKTTAFSLVAERLDLDLTWLRSKSILFVWVNSYWIHYRNTLPIRFQLIFMKFSPTDFQSSKLILIIIISWQEIFEFAATFIHNKRSIMKRAHPLNVNRLFAIKANSMKNHKRHWKTIENNKKEDPSNLQIFYCAWHTDWISWKIIQENP